MQIKEYPFALSMAFVAIASIFGSAQTLADNIQPFNTDTFKALKEDFAQKAFVVSLWSVDCLPCRVELEMLGQLKKEDPDFPLLLISTDTFDKHEEATYILEDYELDKIQSWMFADAFIERLRFTIDPNWYGELPRSYFYNADHAFTAHSGILTRETLLSMLPAGAH